MVRITKRWTDKLKKDFIKSILALVAMPVIIFITGCNSTSRPSSVLSSSEKKKIKSEIIQRVDWYVNAITNNRIEDMLKFWSDSEEFVHAGDGSVFGNYEKWSNHMRNWNDPKRNWLYWNNKDIHVIVLSHDAAVYTMNFENASVLKADTNRVTGSWTYVFRKEGEQWKVIASNGMHRGYNYYTNE